MKKNDAVCACNEPYPEAVLVGNQSRYFCSGVALAPRWVLTAAHCLPATRIGVGRNETLAAPIGVVAAVPGPSGLDVALLKLEQPLALEKTDYPSLIASEPNGPVVHVGYGAPDGSFGVKRLLTLSARGWGCSNEQARETGCRVDTELYVPGSPGHDTCRGDSGGPLYLSARRDDACWPSGAQPRRVLIGITSRSSEGALVACGQGVIATRADQLTQWVSSQISDDGGF